MTLTCGEAMRDDAGMTTPKRQHIAVLGVATVLVVAATLAGCGGSSPPKVAASLTEWKVGLSRTTLKAGKYAFEINNKGTTQHELIAFKTDLARAALPVDAQGDVNEDAPVLTKATDGDDIHVGKAQLRSVDLRQPGTYVFLCNLPGHYKAGMYTTVTVD